MWSGAQRLDASSLESLNSRYRHGNAPPGFCFTALARFVVHIFSLSTLCFLICFRPFSTHSYPVGYAFFTITFAYRWKKRRRQRRFCWRRWVCRGLVPVSGHEIIFRIHSHRIKSAQRHGTVHGSIVLVSTCCRRRKNKQRMSLRQLISRARERLFCGQ